MRQPPAHPQQFREVRPVHVHRHPLHQAVTARERRRRLDRHQVAEDPHRHGDEHAFGLAILLLFLSFGLGFVSNVNVVFGLAAYFALQVLYNLSWRNKSVADVACIALGFVIRVIIGASAINEPVSGWILLCTATLALMLGFGKRRHEFILMGSQSNSRKSLAEY